MSKVYLIGAGPGDEELITLKAINKLKKCTAVMYDRLASPGILKYLDEKCEIYYCGKEPGCHYKTQDEINEMLVNLAKKGHIVGRIKGGDPFVFGRGGEEILSLLEENIEFEVIPGITSAISVPNYAGIPVTHRAIAQGFHVFTGMTADKLNLDWNAVAKIGGTLIFLMGFNNLDIITSRLLENGMDESTPCAIIMRGTTSLQRKVVGTIKNIKEKALEKGIGSPCIILVGDVVQFNDKFNWYEKKPLFGKNICVTRSKEQAGELIEKLRDLGAQTTEINAIKIVNTGENLNSYMDKLSQYDFILFTSVNAVNIFFDYLVEKEYDIRNIKGKFAVIGPATEKALIKRGIKPEIMAEEFVAEDLFNKIKPQVKEGDKILLPRSAQAREYLVEALTEEKTLVDEVTTYSIAKGDLPEGEIFDNVNIVLFTSPSIVRNMIDMVGVEAIKSKECLAIGPITSKELQKHGIEHTVSDEYSNEGIIKKLLENK
ncbi:uroporphyrinogen-III C-methyltransferase [Clostridium sp. MSJ-11]|uniref:uroporphyrinogen-III C-methyltransferase n=1 Tax=Clostridium mobile TaxID=2841512 RepID=A0ABS6EKD7_9CLOT|nr:uroporphyrinogen-III C-methyltransferase [Clostridium mobile]MBU5485592.1 uroporphyrinogen-III C-methyltransferase [Clostridium mobile]